MKEDIPSIESLIGRKLTPQEWLNYYKNIWNKNLMARAVDAKIDENMCKVNAEEKVMEYDPDSGRPTGRYVTVAERFESRKMFIQDALDLLKAVDDLLAIPAEEFEAKVLSKEALAPVVRIKTPEPETPAPAETQKEEGAASEEAKV